jgi:hypothetical protein
MSAHKIQTPGNNPEESIQHTETSCIFKLQDLFSVQVLFAGQEIKRRIEYF